MVWVVLFVALMIPLIAIILDSQLGRAIAARLERDGRALPSDVQEARVAALEAEVERLAGEVETIREANQFLQRLIEERAAGGALPPGEPGPTETEP